MTISALSGRSTRKAPMLDFYAMSMAQGRKVGIGLYHSPQPSGLSVHRLQEEARLAAAECLLDVEEGAPELPDTHLDTEQLARLCSACIQEMILRSKTSKLAHQEKEWLKMVFRPHMPAVTALEVESLVATITWPPTTQKSDEGLKRFAYELEKELSGFTGLAGSCGVDLLVARSESLYQALDRAMQKPSLKTPRPVRIQRTPTA